MFFNAILPSAIAIAIVFLYGCIGEILMEKVGHLNLGIPGIMCMGTVGGCLGVSLYMSNFTNNPLDANWFLLVLISSILSFLFAAHWIFLLLFALSLRGSGQIAAQFTSIWTASISVEQLAILSTPHAFLVGRKSEFGQR